MFFRGLPSVHACLNEECTERRVWVDGKTVLGRFYTEPWTNCKCGARVFEIFTHRDCGTSFMRAFGIGRRADFLWNEQGGTLSQFGALCTRSTSCSKTHTRIRFAAWSRSGSILRLDVCRRCSRPKRADSDWCTGPRNRTGMRGCPHSLIAQSARAERTLAALSRSWTWLRRANSRLRT